MNISRKLMSRHRSLVNDEVLNVLTFPTHERYETQLAKTGHNFYSFNHKGCKKWNSDQLPKPDNYYSLPENQLPKYINYDMILVQSKYWQYQVAQQINQSLRLPIIVLEHTLPTPQTLTPDNIEQMRKMQGNVNVFITEYSKLAWGIEQGVIIHHGIDTDTFSPAAKFTNGSLEKWENEGGSLNGTRGKHILTVANDFKNRDYCLNYKGWERVTKDLNARVIGDNPGWTSSATSSEELAAEYAHAGVYFNSTTISPIPTTLLEAMSCGCPVVSTATCMIPHIIENGVNGFISNDEDELRNYIQLILQDKELADKLGKNARQTIINKFSQDMFINEWNKLFHKIYEVTR